MSLACEKSGSGQSSDKPCVAKALALVVDRLLVQSEWSIRKIQSKINSASKAQKKKEQQ